MAHIRRATLNLNNLGLSPQKLTELFQIVESPKINNDLRLIIDSTINKRDNKGNMNQTKNMQTYSTPLRTSIKHESP
jgi:hypothetical protein